MMINNPERVIAWENRTAIKLNQYEVLDSTNNKAKEYVKNLINRGNTESVREIFVCEKQTKGRGRMGRDWESPAGTGIWMSCLMTPNVSSDVLSEITLLAALGVVKAINHLAVTNSILNIEPKIKWPNDIVVNGKKICGILTELVNDAATGINYVICGIGINVNDKSFVGENYNHATSLYNESGVVWNREELFFDIALCLRQFVQTLEAKKSLGFIKDDYNSLLISMNKEIILKAEEDKYKDETYISRGIDDSGALLVESKDGNVIRVTSGEVSVRGLYGYV
ncbi:MAG: biotin--[acetyl-CoA-carboxylase] ligase [Eubacterium sp.]|nr:biotin--[acetyl-CoA-carboxylase] ligase [Eubacterium sp.]